MNIATLADPLYYLANFRQVLIWLNGRYADMLDPEERAFMAAFEQLPSPAQALLVRLIMRKGTLFRHGRLAYAEIGCIHTAAQPLLALGWLDSEQPLCLGQLFEVLQKPELISRFRHRGISSSLRKAELLQALLPLYPQARRFTEWFRQPGEAVYALQVRGLCERLRLMFFGNLRQDWSEFVLADLGVARYELVELDERSRALRHRHDMQVCMAIYRCREKLEEGADLTEVGNALAQLQTDSPWLIARRGKLMYQVAYEHERHEQFAPALQLYAQCQWPGARLRTIRVLERLGHAHVALDLAGVALLAPENAAEAQAVPRIVHRLRRLLGLGVDKRRKAPEYPRIDLCLPFSSSVEQSVGEHLQTEDGPVFYVENTLLNSLFGLLCWPAIFAPVAGAFFHPFQSGPADLYQADFRQRREHLFQGCLAKLDSNEYRDSIRSTWLEKWGIASPFVYWGAMTEALLEQSLLCIPADHLKHCFERLLGDLKANRAGMPDLIQFWPQQRRYRMIEVKGPGDRLQDNQLRWLDFCAAHQLPVEVCYVEWTL